MYQVVYRTEAREPRRVGEARHICLSGRRPHSRIHLHRSMEAMQLHGSSCPLRRLLFNAPAFWKRVLHGIMPAAVIITLIQLMAWASLIIANQGKSNPMFVTRYTPSSCVTRRNYYIANWQVIRIWLF